MKILFFSNDYPGPHDPTRAVFNLRMCEALAAHHDVRVVCPVAWTTGRMPAAVEGGGATDVPVSYRPYYFPPRVLLAERGRFMWWSLQGYLRRLLQSWRPDVILAYWAHPDGEAALRLGAEQRLPVVQMVGGSDVLLLRDDRRRWARVQRVLTSVDAVVAIGRHLAREVVRLGVPADRVTCLYRPVDTSMFCPGSQSAARHHLGLPLDGPRLLWVGRFVDVKGVDVLTRALPELRRALPGVRCSLVGEGPGVGHIRTLAAELGVAEVIRFEGAVAQKDLAPWYRAADVTVLPSHSEGVPNVLLESMACGVPFVASAVGGVPEIADAALDRLVPPGEPAPLAAALADVLGRPATAERRFMPVSPDVFARRLAAVLVDAVRACAAVKSVA